MTHPQPPAAVSVLAVDPGCHFLYVDTSKSYPALFLGADPGASGAVAAVGWNGEARGWITGEATDRDLLDWLVSMTTTGGVRIHTAAALEEVGAKPRIAPGGQRVSMGAKSAFTFGASYGRLSMALVAAGIPFERVLPAKWQAVMRCRTKGDKGVSKARAQELLPGVIRITHRNADAFLLALYARTINQPLVREGRELELEVCP